MTGYKTEKPVKPAQSAAFDTWILLANSGQSSGLEVDPHGGDLMQVEQMQREFRTSQLGLIAIHARLTLTGDYLRGPSFRVPIPISIAVFLANTTSFPRARKCE